MSVSAGDELLVCRNNPPNQGVVLASRHFSLSRQHANIIDSFKDDQIADPGLRDYIMIESRQCIWPEAIGEQTVSADTLIQNRKIARTWLPLQALRKNIRPPIISVGRSAMSIGD